MPLRNMASKPQIYDYQYMGRLSLCGTYKTLKPITGLQITFDWAIYRPSVDKIKMQFKSTTCQHGLILTKLVRKIAFNNLRHYI